MKAGKLDEMSQKHMDAITSYYGIERITELTEEDVKHAEEVIEGLRKYLEERKKKKLADKGANA